MVLCCSPRVPRREYRAASAAPRVPRREYSRRAPVCILLHPTDYCFSVVSCCVVCLPPAKLITTRLPIISHESDLEDMDRDIAALQLTSDSLVNIDSTMSSEFTQQTLTSSRTHFGDISSPASDKDISLLSPDTAGSQTMLYGADDTDISEGSPTAQSDRPISDQLSRSANQ